MIRRFALPSQARLTKKGDDYGTGLGAEKY